MAHPLGRYLVNSLIRSYYFYWDTRSVLEFCHQIILFLLGHPFCTWWTLSSDHIIFNRHTPWVCTWWTLSSDQIIFTGTPVWYLNFFIRSCHQIILFLFGHPLGTWTHHLNVPVTAWVGPSPKGLIISLFIILVYYSSLILWLQEEVLLSFIFIFPLFFSFYVTTLSTFNFSKKKERCKIYAYKLFRFPHLTWSE